MQRVPVISSNNQPLMPTKSSRARRWIKEGTAIGKFNDLGQFYVQLKVEPFDDKTQPIAVGIDPGKLYSEKGDLVNSPKGIGYVSGQTKKQISVSDANWKRLGQIVFSKVTLIRRSNGLIVTC